MRNETELAAGEVHVWQGVLDVSDETYERLAGSLSPSELDSAHRFRKVLHHRRFVAGRGMLRDVLARYARVQPECLTFATGPAGKPSLEPNPDDVRFNASNAGGRAVIAVTIGREIGIDLEPLRPVPDALELARRFFSPAEIAALTATPERERDGAFLTIWTRKEAYVKALGGGLGVPLDSFSVSLGAGATVQRLDGGDSASGRAWSVRPLACVDGWVGALVVEGMMEAVRYFSWPPDLL